MARIAKKPDIRRLEIVEEATKLFLTKGVTNTTVSDIVRAVGVAQGTFYWYFDSKQDVVNAVIEAMCEESRLKMIEIAGAEKIDAVQKLLKIRDEVFKAVVGGGELMEYYHQQSNREVHDRLVDEMAKRLVPVLVEVVKQGIKEGLFDTPYPEKAAAFVFGATHVINEDIIYKHNQSLSEWKKALTDFVLKALGYKDNGRQVQNPKN